MILQNFVVFEGGDGSGTSTQIELLRRRFDSCRDRALPALFTTCEPTGGPIGAMIRRFLRGDLPLRPETAARLFAADRNEHLYGSGAVADRCGRGELAVSDRYVPSSLVYQGLDCGEELPALLNRDFPLPQLLLFFDLDPETALDRLEGRPYRDLYERLDFQVRVRERYRALLPAYASPGTRLEYLDASRPAEAVAEDVWRLLQELPIFGSRNT
ncbi:MAG: dTMP kinase [Spirochaetaceae bacterium]|jgi:dTMP kinase|nr:dTMP kinase [Spirochaetaceae bacterium]